MFLFLSYISSFKGQDNLNAGYLHLASPLFSRFGEIMNGLHLPVLLEKKTSIWITKE